MQRLPMQPHPSHWNYDDTLTMMRQCFTRLLEVIEEDDERAAFTFAMCVWHYGAKYLATQRALREQQHQERTAAHEQLSF